MKKNPEICRPEEVKKAFMTMFANNSIIPVVGAGFSCNLPAKNGAIPNGHRFKEHMIDALKRLGNLSESEITVLKANRSQIFATTMKTTSLCLKK